MHQTGMEGRVQSMARHQNKNGTSSNSNVRQSFFADVSCDLLEQLHQLYRPDFDLFEYEMGPFQEICSNENLS